MRNVVIVGSGNRVRNNFLPALGALADQARVVGIASRRREHAMDVAAAWGCEAAESMAELPWSEADTVVVSISPGALVETLARIAARRPGIDLVVDTPALPATAAWRHRLFDSFGTVAVAEDYMNFPPFELMRRFCAPRARPSLVRLDGSGYSYHGIALIRSFFDFEPVVSMTSRVAGGRKVTCIELAGGGRGELVQPYERGRGVVAVTGDGYELRYTLPGVPAGTGGCAGPWHTVESPDGSGAEFSIGEMRYGSDRFRALMDLPRSFDRSVFNLMKTCGLIEVLRSLSGHGLNGRYGPRNGVYDAVLGRLTQRSCWDSESLILGMLNRFVHAAAR